MPIAPMLAQDVSRVFITINVVEFNDGSCNGFSNVMKRQSIVVLVELGMWNCRTIHH